MLLLLTLLGCGGPSEPAFDAWLAEAVARCTPGAQTLTDCDSGPCIGIVRTPAGEELDLKGCMGWPYTGMGSKKRTQVCGDTTWRLTAVSQLPELDRSTAQSALQIEAARVADALDAIPCP